MTTSMEQVIRPVVQDWVPCLTAPQYRQLTRWVLGAVLAGSANGPSMIQALTTAGIAGVSTLTDQWEQWLAQAAHQTTDPPVEDRPVVVSPLAIGAALLRVILDWWPDDRLILGMDASLRRDDVVLLRMSVLYRGTALPIGWVMVPATTPGAWAPHWDRLLAWAATVLDAQRLVVVVTDRGLWSPQLWHSIQRHGWHPVMRVQAHATFRPRGQARQPVRDLVLSPGSGWIGHGTAFKDASKRLEGTLAVVWDEGANEPWALLTDLPPRMMDPAWYALRMWDEEGFRASTSMGWHWQRGQLDDPDAVAWQDVVVAVATLWTLAVGTRIEDAQQMGVPPSQVRTPPTTTPRRTRRSGTAHRVVSLLVQGMQTLRRLWTRGRTWLRLWLRPEPWPKMIDRWRVHIHTPSSSRKTLLVPPLSDYSLPTSFPSHFPMLG